jgi:hypothetical protein
VELTWTAEGGTDELQISTANSGGDSGTAWDTVNVGTDATLVYDTAQPAHGTYSMRHATGATSTTANAIWDDAIGTPVARLYGRIYLRSGDMTSTRSILRIRTGTTQIVRLQINASGELELRNSANSVVDTSTTVFSDDTLYRIEFDVQPGNPVTNTVNIYVGDSTTLTEAVSASSNFSAGTSIDEFGVGNFAAGSNIPATWFDDIQINDSGLPGPAVTNATVTPAAIAVVAAMPAAATSAAAVAAPAAVAATTVVPQAAVAADATVAPAAAAAVAATPQATVAAGARLAALVDDFNDDTIDTARWPNNYGGVSESGGRFQIDCDVAQWSGLKSATRYILEESRISLRAYPADPDTATVSYLSTLVTTTTPGTDAGFNIDTASSGIAFLLREGFSDAGAVFDTYSPTDHAWLRLREESGSLFWETSADGQAWTLQRTETSPAWVGDETLALVCEAHRDAGADNVAEVDNVNVIPATVTPAAIATTVGVPQATPVESASATVEPAAIAVTGGLPAAATTSGADAAPATIAAVTALPGAALETDAAPAPATIAATAALPAAAPSAGSTTLPAVAAVVCAMPAAAASGEGNTTAAPDTITAVAAVPAAAPSAGSTATPAVAAVTISLPAASLSAGTQLTPATITATVAVPQTGMSASATLTPATVTAVISLPAAAPSTGTTTAPQTITVTVALPAAATALGAAVTPAVLQAIAALPAVTVLTVVRNIVLTVGPPGLRWRTGPPGGRWRTAGVDTRWRAGPPTT